MFHFMRAEMRTRAWMNMNSPFLALPKLWSWFVWVRNKYCAKRASIKIRMVKEMGKGGNIPLRKWLLPETAPQDMWQVFMWGLVCMAALWVCWQLSTQGAMLLLHIEQMSSKCSKKWLVFERERRWKRVYKTLNNWKIKAPYRALILFLVWVFCFVLFFLALSPFQTLSLK